MVCPMLRFLGQKQKIEGVPLYYMELLSKYLYLL